MRGFVASGHELTSRAALEVLAAGGNAFDGAVAGLLAATVTEPLLASLAGGGFLLAERPNGERTIFDFFSDTPSQRRADADFYPIVGDFGDATQEFHIGLGSMAVPGMVAGLHAVHRRLGRLPFPALAAPAIRYAREGVPVNAFQAQVAAVLAPIVTATPEAAARFGPDRHPVGALRRDEAYATLLEALASEPPDWFYVGEPAQALARLCAERGGHVTSDDLASYGCIEREPLFLAIDDHRLWTNPIPSCGGALIAHALALLARLPAATPDSPAWLATLARVQAATTARRHAVRLQHRHDAAAVAELLDAATLDQLADELAGYPLARGGTTHLSVVDGDGNLAATTVSNGEGCGVMLPGTGIHLNNFLGEEDLNPDGPGAWRPGVRMSSMMAPTIVERADGARLALGSGGSNRLRTAITQVILRWALGGQALAEAIAAPRVHVEGGTLNFEPGHQASGVAALCKLFEQHVAWKSRNLFFGGVHAVMLQGGTVSGCADPRRGGHSAGIA